MPKAVMHSDICYYKYFGHITINCELQNYGLSQLNTRELSLET